MLCGCHKLAMELIENSREVTVAEDKFNKSVIISTEDLSVRRPDFGENSYRLVYYKDGKNEIYYIKGNLLIHVGIRGRNLYKATASEGKELKIVIEPDSRLGWYNDNYEIKLSREYLKKDIEIKLYGNKVSDVINISSKQIDKFLVKIDGYNSNK